jgi:hypothetical protein
VSSTSDYISVKANTAYMLSYDYTTLLNTSDRGYSFYDSDKKYISGNLYKSPNKNSIITAPENGYVRFCYDNSCTNIQFEEGATATKYEPYGESPSPDYPSEIISLGYENLFKPALIADNGVAIKVNHADVELDGDEFVFTCKNSTDLYFGQIANEGTAYAGDQGNLIDVTGMNSISYRLSNELFTKNYITYYDENKMSLKAAETRKFANTIDLTKAPVGTKYISFRFGYSPATVGEIYRVKVQMNKGDAKRLHVSYDKYGVEIKNAGINLLDLINNTYTLNGITAIVKDGKITLNGTATATAFIGILSDTPYNIKEGEQFTVSAFNSEINENVKIRVNSQAVYDTALNSINRSATYTRDAKNALIGHGIQIRIENGTTLTNYSFYPMLNRGLPLDYELY